MGIEDAKATVQKIREGNPAAWLALVNASLLSPSITCSLTAPYLRATSSLLRMLQQSIG
jgi:hypothetical protein